MILYYLFGFPMGITSIVLNIPLFYIAYKYISPRYCFNGLYGMLAFSIAWDATAFVQNYTTVNILLACIYGGILEGIGAAMLFRVNAHSGGSDIIAGIINKYRGVGFGTVGFVFNCLIMLVSAYMFGLEISLYTLLSMFITGVVINRVVDGFDFKKNIIIISDKAQELSAAIMEETDRGTTFINAQGGYTGEDKKMLFVVVKLRQVTMVREVVKSIDPVAFVIITDVRDVFGRGFSLPDNYNIKRKYPANPNK